MAPGGAGSGAPRHRCTSFPPASITRPSACPLVATIVVRGSPPPRPTEKVAPQGAAYNAEVGQFLIDYDGIRTSPSPDDALLDFMQSTYEAAANFGKWDRKALERQT